MNSGEVSQHPACPLAAIENEQVFQSDGVRSCNVRQPSQRQGATCVCRRKKAYAGLDAVQGSIATLQTKGDGTLRTVHLVLRDLV
jgi:hypothetical protein